MTHWLLIQGNEDGDPITWLSDEGLHELLADPIETYGIRRFLDRIPSQSNPSYWNPEAGLLLHAKLVVPEPVTTAWRLP